MAAEVAVATVGLDKVMHIPKGMMLTMGLWSIMLAAGMLEAKTRLVGSTFSVLGAIPKVHISIAPVVTCIGIWMRNCWGLCLMLFYSIHKYTVYNNATQVSKKGSPPNRKTARVNFSFLKPLQLFPRRLQTFMCSLNAEVDVLAFFFSTGFIFTGINIQLKLSSSRIGG